MTTTSPAALHPRRAALAMLGAMVLVGTVDNSVVLIAEVMSVWQFFIIRTAMALPMTWALAWFWGRPLLPSRWGAAALRSALVAAAMVLYFGALGFVPIAQALAGLFTAPIFVLLITVLVQGQRIGPWRILAVLLGFAGVLCVLQPDTDGVGWISILPVLGGVLYASSAVITRTLCAGEDTLVLLAGMFLFQALFGVLGLLVTGGGADFITRDWTWEMGPVMIWVVAQAVLSLIGVGLIIWAYQHGEASHVAVFEYSIFIVGPVVAWLAFGQTVDVVTLLGIGLIAVAGIVIAVRSGA